MKPPEKSFELEKFMFLECCLENFSFAKIITIITIITILVIITIITITVTIIIMLLSRWQRSPSKDTLLPLFLVPLQLPPLV